MQIIRRLYFYAVTLISLETVIWALIGLMRTVAAPQVLGAAADRLAAPLAFIVVGLPVFFLHWRFVQCMAAESAEEASARLRAAFFYVALAATLIPAVQNTLALLSRSLTQAFGLETSTALLGSGQTLADNLIAMGVNLLMAAYFYQRNRQNWSGEICASLSAAEKERLEENYADVRRLYRHLWLGYSLALTVLGVRQLLTFLLVSPQAIGTPPASMLANGLALLAVGLPIWVYAQRLIAESLTDQRETLSWLRLAFLFALSWLSLFVTLYQLGKMGDLLLRLVMGEALAGAQILQSLRPAIAALIPFGVVWGYYQRQRLEAVDAQELPALRLAIGRFYSTIVVSASLVALILGTSRLLAFVVNLLLGSKSYFIESGRSELSASLAILLIAVPLWLRTWKPLQGEATLEGEQGEAARRSLVRRGMLYLWVFVGVVGTMFATGSFFFEIMRSLLGTPSDQAALDSLLRLRLTLIFLAILLYHLTVLRRDQRLAAATLAARQAAFAVAIWLPKDSHVAQELRAALQREAPQLPIIWLDEGEPPSADGLKDAKALVMTAERLTSPAAEERAVWTAFEGKCLVLPTSETDWYWIGASGQSLTALARQTARALRLLAEGQPLPRQSDNTLLTSMAYVLAALFLLQIVAVLMLSVIAPLVD